MPEVKAKKKITKKKKTIVTLINANKSISAILGLIIALAAVWALFKDWRTGNIRGQWQLTFINENCSYIPYINETHTQRIFFTQNEKTISGDGEKWEYNGQLLPFDKHRKLEYKGTIDGKEIEATYVLHGEKRISNGKVHLKLANDGKTLTGTFSGTAGSCDGKIEGKIIED